MVNKPYLQKRFSNSRVRILQIAIAILFMQAAPLCKSTSAVVVKIPNGWYWNFSNTEHDRIGVLCVQAGELDSKLELDAAAHFSAAGIYAVSIHQLLPKLNVYSAREIAQLLHKQRIHKIILVSYKGYADDGSLPVLSTVQVCLLKVQRLKRYSDNLCALSPALISFVEEMKS